MRWILACVMLAGVSLMASCYKGEQPSSFQAAYFSLIINDISGSGGATANVNTGMSVSSDGGTRTLTLVSNRAWSINYDQAPWITISPTSGKGRATITVTVAPNETLAEDFIYMSVTNNTLLVMEDFKITRQNFLGTYRGTNNTAITSPIASICTTCEGSTLSARSSTVVITEESGSVKMMFRVIFPTDPEFALELPFNVTRQTIIEDGVTAFVFTGSGTYDMAGLGAALGDATVTGVKNTSVSLKLSGGRLIGGIMIAPGAGNTIVPTTTTAFAFNGAK